MVSDVVGLLGLERRRWLFNTILVVGIVDLIHKEFFDFTLHGGSASHALMTVGLVCDFVIGAASVLLKAAIAFGAGRASKDENGPSTSLCCVLPFRISCR
jgi:hypothetical protein